MTWQEVAEELGCDRTGKQCRDRWQNYLRPGIKKGGWTSVEEELIQDMYTTFGPRYVRFGFAASRSFFFFL